MEIHLPAWLKLVKFFSYKITKNFFLGRAECELNKLHACILEHLSVEKAFEIILCLMRSFESSIDDVSGIQFATLVLLLNQNLHFHYSAHQVKMI